MQGLMYRRILPENRGMLFVFPETARHAMWMMNTYLPLSVAFLDEHGVIINIEDMKPQTEDIAPRREAREIRAGSQPGLVRTARRQAGGENRRHRPARRPRDNERGSDGRQ